MTESFNHKSNTNDVDQTAHLFNRFIVVACAYLLRAFRNIILYLNHFLEHMINYVKDFFNSILNANEHESPFCFAYAVATMYI